MFMTLEERLALIAEQTTEALEAWLPELPFIAHEGCVSGFEVKDELYRRKAGEGKKQ
jgi:hypothetical protein